MTYSIQTIKEHIAKVVSAALGVTITSADFVLPPNPDLGDISLPLFQVASAKGGPANAGNPNELAAQVADTLQPDGIIASAQAAGPYLNITLNYEALGAKVLAEATKAEYGVHNTSDNVVVLEYASPNVNKPFHVGHLRNVTTGESLARLLANTGHQMKRVNYTSDIGLNVAKSVWGVLQHSDEFAAAQTATPSERALFLGKVYAYASEQMKANAQAAEEIKQVNQGIYNGDDAVMTVYETTKAWSLEYFAYMYTRLRTHFDKDYFESEMAEPGLALVQAGMQQGIFVKSEGAVIFRGGEHGLHDRVFISSQGLPTYEGKEVALAQRQLSDWQPNAIIHITGREQAEYFKVIIRALEYVLPESKGKIAHLPYGWVSLKGMGKMSSRTGKVVLAEFILNEVQKAIHEVATANENTVDEKTEEKIALAAVKYAILKNGIQKDMVFDLQESISLSGNSGPYLLYTYARIHSILKKAGKITSPPYKGGDKEGVKLQRIEQQLLFTVARFPEITAQAAAENDPSLVARYLFELAQTFNDYYHQTPILKSDENERAFRLQLITAVAAVLDRGCYLLGFETVEEM